MPPTRKKTDPASVLFATPECAPLVKTGGLGDVSAALPAALHALGHDVRVLMPCYPAVREADPRAGELAAFTLFGHKVRLLDMRLPSGVALIAIDAPALYDRGGGPYQQDNGDDWEDNAIRFGVLSRVAAMLGTDATPLPWRPDVVHCHDWPAALAPVYLRHAPGRRAASLVTIHNLAFQGLFGYGEADAIELPDAARGTDGVEFYGKVSFLKGGLVASDAINTVSPTYAREIQTEELGMGLAGVLRMRAKDLHGILNGIDTALWNPETDPCIPSRYGAQSLEMKAANKQALKKALGLDMKTDAPLAVTVSRLAHQKGIDLIAEAIPRLARIPVQVGVVGAGEHSLIEQLRAAAIANPGMAGDFIGFDEPLAHLAEAGADFFLMPSRFEPCGMNQMYSQRYGTPPVATATGGLVDTIVDGTTGFLMKEASVDALVASVERAVRVYRNPAQWTALQRNGMARDFGWDNAAREYAALYARIRATS
ncbi:MAG: glycogen synthase GlgA [Usitatibacter sp.]